MKLRKLIITAIGAMTASCLGVYLLVPAGEVNEVSAAPVAATEEEPAAAEEPEPEKPSSLSVDARIGHDELQSSGDRTTYVMVELRGKESVAGGSMQTSTALVLDTSGSMVGMRIIQAREAAKRWIQRAPEGDVVSVIGFSDQARQLVPRTRVDASSRPLMLQQLESIQPEGATCLSCGVQQAAQLVNDNERIQRVVVLSDGRANKGIQDPAGIRMLAATCRDMGISVSTVGLGTGYNEKVLSALAFDANGLHHFVESAAELPRVFEREESILRATVASDVKTHIDLAPGVQLVQVLDRKFRQSGDRVTVEVGPIASGAARTVLLQVRVPGTLGDTPVATASIAFRDVGEGEDRTLERKLATHVGDTMSSLDGLVAMRLERARTGRALQRAADLFAQGRKQEALAVLDERVTALRPRGAALSEEARERGDARAEDIRRDLQRQIDQASRARRSFRKARPAAPKPVKRAAPMAMDAFL